MSKADDVLRFERLLQRQVETLLAITDCAAIMMQRLETIDRRLAMIDRRLAMRDDLERFTTGQIQNN